MRSDHLTFFLKIFWVFSMAPRTIFRHPDICFFPPPLEPISGAAVASSPHPRSTFPRHPSWPHPAPPRLHLWWRKQLHLARGTVLLANYFSRTAGMNFVNELTNVSNDHWSFIAYQRHRTFTANWILLSNTRTIAPSYIFGESSHGNQSKPSGVIFWKSYFLWRTWLHNLNIAKGREITD